MVAILRSFCVVSCFASGIYGCIIYYYFRNAKRMVWFSALCFALGINIYMVTMLDPYTLADPKYVVAGVFDNVFLASVALITLCMNVYAGFDMPLKYAKFHAIYNYICVMLAATCMLIPGSFFSYMYAVLLLFNIFTYIFAIRLSFNGLLSGKRPYIYQIVGISLMLIATVASIILFRANSVMVYTKLITAPVFALLQNIMLTKQHAISVNKTKKLSTSLSETIERINHSDNALMCTQMKADFLYKSLDLISQKCDEDPFIAEDLTVSLSKYLRHTLNFQQLKGIVPLSNEIELTKAFIAIEKERNRKITFEYKFPDPLPDFHIPPLSIQPLVENAINHAFPPEQDNPKITITIIPYRDYYHIDVSDNGLGMDEETVSALTESLHESARIGVYNIHTRLINLFGKGLVLQSAPGVGTSVSFVIPPDAINYLKEREKEEQA